MRVRTLISWDEPDYTIKGTIDKTTRTRSDDRGGKRQTETGKENTAVKPLVKPHFQRGKKRYVYSINPATGSRTRLSEITEYPVREVNRVFLSKFRKWEYLSQRVFHHLSLMLPPTGEEYELSSTEGDINMGELIEILSGSTRVGAFDFLDFYRAQADRNVEAVIGLDVSGSTGCSINDEDTILDIEKAFALIFGRALKLCTDRVSVYAFNSMTATNVYRVDPLEAVSSLSSDMANRDGDFIRYIADIESRSNADTRYFFLISDGIPSSPNYEGREALDDTVAAMREAVKSGIKLVYLNIDQSQAPYFHLFRKEADYAEHFRKPEDILPRISGLVQSIIRGM